MRSETFSSIGKNEAIEKLYEGTPYRPFDGTWFELQSKGYVTTKNRTFMEGTDFDLSYFPLKHLGYKCVTAVTGELYSEMSHPRTLSAVMSVSSKLDYGEIKEIWSGIVIAAKEHGYSKVSLDLRPSLNGLTVNLAASGETFLLTGKRRMPAKSMDLICISGNIGAAYLGFQILEREKRMMESGKKDKTFVTDDYKIIIGEYLKPEINPGIVTLLEEEDIIPSFGYLISEGLADTVRRLVRDSGLGAKIYVDKIPFAGKTFDLGKELGIDPVTAALNGGDDMRLLFTIPIGKHDKFRHDFQTFDIIGHLAKPEVGAALVTPDGVEFPIKAQGWK